MLLIFSQFVSKLLTDNVYISLSLVRALKAFLILSTITNVRNWASTQKIMSVFYAIFFFFWRHDSPQWWNFFISALPATLNKKKWGYDNIHIMTFGFVEDFRCPCVWCQRCLNGWPEFNSFVGKIIRGGFNPFLSSVKKAFNPFLRKLKSIRYLWMTSNYQLICSSQFWKHAHTFYEILDVTYFGVIFLRIFSSSKS